MQKKITRFEMNSQVKTTLQKRDVNLSELQVSCSTSSVRISGNFIKSSGKEFNTKMMETIYSELSSLPCVRDVIIDVQNWNISPSGITPKGGKVPEKKEKEEKKEDKQKDKKDEEGQET